MYRFCKSQKVGFRSFTPEDCGCVQENLPRFQSSALPSLLHNSIPIPGPNGTGSILTDA